DLLVSVEKQSGSGLNTIKVDPLDFGKSLSSKQRYEACVSFLKDKGCQTIRYSWEQRGKKGTYATAKELKAAIDAAEKYGMEVAFADVNLINLSDKDRNKILDRKREVNAKSIANMLRLKVEE